MPRWIALVLVLVLVLVLALGCDEGGTASFETIGSTAPKSGVGGFSADLATQLGSGAGSNDTTISGSAAKVGSGSGGSSAVAIAAGSDALKAGSNLAIAVPSPPINTRAPRVAIKPSAELAAIKLSMSPNWDRDVGEAGTISLVVKIPGREDARVFSFRYGYEDAKAPTEREAYKKWLADNRILNASLDRQRGAAWYIEGVDGSGTPAFRIVVTYGGRKLICGGSLYKDATSNQLGDIRDKTIIQAKEICETVAL